ncbi:MAG: metalloregulator ArsR/SmtB family transcription factor [Oscillospiraceae bacterium]|nr:metalloregulator ArsR/SmtB family transcription factor [Oscillospiraceae bacterium]
MSYEQAIIVFKALSDNNRLQIVDMLSCGELCACKILEKFNITQPTLSHHMKVLNEAGIVNSRKQGSWSYYSLNSKNIANIMEFIKSISSNKDNCICKY